MTFLIRWKHKDGSLVEFSDHGWRSDDPEKNEWLIKINELCSTSPVIAPIARTWLQETCQLVEPKGPEDAHNPAGVPDNPCGKLGNTEAISRGVNDSLSLTFSDKRSFFRGARWEPRMSIRSTSLACGKFFRSRRIATARKLQ